MKKLTCYDLMIGDWIYRPDCYDKVIEVKKDTILGSDSLRGLIPITDLQPIPLTAEILERSGFELYKQDFTSRRVYKFGCFDYIEVNDYNEDSRYNYFSIGCYIEYKHFGTLQRYIHDVMKIRYVHELQHALHLCEVDNEIIL